MHTAVMSRGLRDTAGNARSGCSVRSRSRGGPPVLGDTHTAEMEEETEEQRRQKGDGRGRWGGRQGGARGRALAQTSSSLILQALRDLTSQPPPSLPPPQALRSSAGDPRGARRCHGLSVCVAWRPGPTHRLRPRALLEVCPPHRPAPPPSLPPARQGEGQSLGTTGQGAL